MQGSYPVPTDAIVKRTLIPLVNNSTEPGQEAVISQAIKQVTEAYHEGKKVAIHCAAGLARTGTVAIGTLLELGLAVSVEEAESTVKRIRPAVEISPAQHEALQHLYPPHAHTLAPSPVPVPAPVSLPPE